MKRIRTLIGRLLDFLTYIEFLVPTDIRSQFTVYQKSEISCTPYVAIVVMFKTVKEVDSDLMQTLRYLSKLHYEVVVVANANPSQRVLKEFSKNFSIISRPNIGRDFGAYKVGLGWITQNIRKGPLDRLILLNDSVKWTPAAIEACLSRAELSRQSLLGVTTSRQRNLHIQSYFYFVKDTAIDVFIEKFLDLKDVRMKRSIIHLGERKISKVLLKNGLQFDALFSERELERERRNNSSSEEVLHLTSRPVNTINYYSRELRNLSDGIIKKA